MLLMRPLGPFFNALFPCNPQHDALGGALDLLFGLLDVVKTGLGREAYLDKLAVLLLSALSRRYLGRFEIPGPAHPVDCGGAAS